MAYKPSPAPLGRHEAMPEYVGRELQRLSDVLSEGRARAYSPTWKGSVSDPAIGDGTLIGWFCDVAGLLVVSVQLTVGASTSTGSGEWRFGLPKPASAGPAWIGAALALDANTNTRAVGAARIDSGGSYCTVETHGVTSKVAATSPWTWAVSDQLWITLGYMP